MEELIIGVIVVLGIRIVLKGVFGFFGANDYRRDR
ncbi:hypothetical protein HMPREF1212_05173 [Parabacteroides sp. HGS0025]|jgi:hypothetical protein|nr:hypothetical protein HMPREF1212_05173 [Parabacteroides sp. HGS0025]